MKIFIPPLLRDGAGVQTMVLYIKTNIHHSILFSPPSHFKGTFTIFPQGHFIMTPSPPENLENTYPLCLFHPLLQLSTKDQILLDGYL